MMTSPLPNLQIHSVHQDAMGTPSHVTVPLQRHANFYCHFSWFWEQLYCPLRLKLGTEVRLWFPISDPSNCQLIGVAGTGFQTSILFSYSQKNFPVFSATSISRCIDSNWAKPLVMKPRDCNDLPIFKYILFAF